MNNIKYFVITLLILAIIISCSISPEIVEKAELTPQIKYLDSPSEVKVKSDYEGNKIDLEWCEVEGATHYEVEYESVVDYLSGKEMKKYITLSPSFSLSSFLSSSDKRYVFRVRAGKKNDDGVLYSRYTDLKEGALIDDFTVFFVMIFGDGGYGALLLSAGIFSMIPSFKAKKTPSAMSFLLTLLGFATMVWGAVTCTWFGLRVDQIPDFLKMLSVPAISNVTSAVSGSVIIVAGLELTKTIS